MSKITVKMLAINPDTKKLEEVFPESEVEVEEMTPRFLCNTMFGERWLSVPGVTAAEMYDEWLFQMKGGRHE